MIRVMLRAVAWAELARWRAARSTSCGMIPRSAGEVKEVDRPLSVASAITAPRR
jgi:hypothetical protein